MTNIHEDYEKNADCDDRSRPSPQHDGCIEAPTELVDLGVRLVDGLYVGASLELARRGLAFRDALDDFGLDGRVASVMTRRLITVQIPLVAEARNVSVEEFSSRAMDNVERVYDEGWLPSWIWRMCAPVNAEVVCVGVPDTVRRRPTAAPHLPGSSAGRANAACTRPPGSNGPRPLRQIPAIRNELNDTRAMDRDEDIREPRHPSERVRVYGPNSEIIDLSINEAQHAGLLADALYLGQHRASARHALALWEALAEVGLHGVTARDVARDLTFSGAYAVAHLRNVSRPEVVRRVGDQLKIAYSAGWSLSWIYHGQDW